ncbi:MAG: biopolymer transporter ExbD [Planctomycetaceae bacterium]|nr:biopolymer transporter ExbD [Planctomycetaceae bacterium]
MRLPSNTNQRSPLRFNITPLIDVVFLLIIFFLVASHFVRNEQSEPVHLPAAGQAENDAEPVRFRLTITIDRTGLFFVAGEQQEAADVLRQIEDLKRNATEEGEVPEVRIRTDRESEYRHVRMLLEQCASLGIRTVRFAVTVEA